MAPWSEVPSANHLYNHAADRALGRPNTLLPTAPATLSARIDDSDLRVGQSTSAGCDRVQSWMSSTGQRDQEGDALMRTLSPEPFASGSISGAADRDDRDTRMRAASEEPSGAIPITAVSSVKPKEPTPRGSTGSTASGTGVTRNPSLRARDAFSRLRIGSFGTAPRPSLPIGPGSGSSAPGSPTSENGSSTSRRGSGAPAPDTRHQTPAASFLSAFSPASSVGSARSPSPPPSGQHSRIASGPHSYAPFVLPPRGDEEGFRLCAKHDDHQEWEYELGRELGKGGMGLVREAVRRRRAHPPGTDGSMDPKDETRVAVKIIPRRHPHYVSLSALRESLGAGALDGDHATVHMHPAPTPSPAHGSAGPSAMSVGGGPRRASLRGAALGIDRDRFSGGGELERSRSTSSPMRPHLGMRGVSMAPLDTPAPSPPEIDESVLGTSAPRLEGGYFAAAERERASSSREAGGRANGEVDLLDLLLQRELSLWRQLSRLVPRAHESDVSRTTRWTGKGGHPHIVALLGTHRTAEFDYVFMPLAEGGTLLEYVTRPELRDREPSDVSASTSASSTASSVSRRSASRGHARNGSHQPRRGRASIPIAGTALSLSPPASAAPAAAPSGLPLAEAGAAFLQVAESVRWLHRDAGVVHRDLKLENVVGCWEATAGGISPKSPSLSRGRQQSQGKTKTPRVWKIADFGLAEVIPPPTPGRAGSEGAVQGVQPLAALARAGSLSRPGAAGTGDANVASHALAASVGPGAPLRTAHAHSPAASGLSASAFLPSPHQPPIAPAPFAGPPSNSPLSALLHPVGSLPYSSPEAMRSPVPIVHPSIDIWALGCILHGLVAGRLPIWEEWELRLRVKLVKGDWDTPSELDPEAEGLDDEEREERAMALEVLRGCLDKDPHTRWDIQQVCDSAWMQRIRAREAEARSIAAAAAAGTMSPPQSEQPQLSPTSPTSARQPSRGRPSTRASASSGYPGGPPPAPSAGAREPSGSTGGTHGGKSSSRSRTRLTTRSSSRSSAYTHQLGAAGGSEQQDHERKERGRSERRARWDEAGVGSRMRSSSRASASTVEDEAAAAVAQGLRRGRSASRPGVGSVAGRRPSATGSRDSREGKDEGSGTPTVLETVGEPY